MLNCHGGGVKILIADNACVRNSRAKCIAVPQYFVGQGLARDCAVVYLENNHGKFPCDMLFGQFQTKRRRTDAVGIDGILVEF